jgi:hypothetical protein
LFSLTTMQSTNRPNPAKFGRLISQPPTAESKDGPLAPHPFRSSAPYATTATQHYQRCAKVDQIERSPNPKRAESRVESHGIRDRLLCADGIAHRLFTSHRHGDASAGRHTIALPVLTLSGFGLGAAGLSADFHDTIVVRPAKVGLSPALRDNRTSRARQNVLRERVSKRKRGGVIDNEGRPGACGLWQEGQRLSLGLALPPTIRLLAEEEATTSPFSAPSLSSALPGCGATTARDRSRRSQ